MLNGRDLNESRRCQTAVAFNSFRFVIAGSSTSTLAAAAKKAAVAGGIMMEADSVLDELVRLKEWQKDMEKT